MNIHDLIIVLVAIVSCAALLTAHISIIAGLMVRPPRWRAVVAFFFPPLAPYWAFRERLRARAGIWIGAGVIYAIARIAAG